MSREMWEIKPLNWFEPLGHKPGQMIVADTICGRLKVFLWDGRAEQWSWCLGDGQNYATADSLDAAKAAAEAWYLARLKSALTPVEATT